MRKLPCVVLMLLVCGCSGSKTRSMVIANNPVFNSQGIEAQILGIANAKDFSVVRLVIKNETNIDYEFKVSYCELESNGNKIYAFSDPEKVLSFANKGFKMRYLIPYIGLAAVISDKNKASADVHTMAASTLQDRIIAKNDLIAGSLYFPPIDDVDKFKTYISSQNNKLKIIIPIELEEEK